MTLGLSFAVLVVGHLVWFRYGWTDLPLRCVDQGWGEWREIYGELTPQAAASFERLLTTLYGEDAANRPQPGRVVVRPAVIVFGDDGRLRDLTIMMTDRLTNQASSVLTLERSKDCRLVQQVLMADGQAQSCEMLWTTWLLYGQIRQADRPWLTSFFRVEQPSPGQMYNLPSDALPRPDHWPSEIDVNSLPEGVRCGPSINHKVFFSTILAGGAIIGAVKWLWPF